MFKMFLVLAILASSIYAMYCYVMQLSKTARVTLLKYMAKAAACVAVAIAILVTVVQLF